MNLEEKIIRASPHHLLAPAANERPLTVPRTDAPLIEGPMQHKTAILLTVLALMSLGGCSDQAAEPLGVPEASRLLTPFEPPTSDLLSENSNLTDAQYEELKRCARITGFDVTANAGGWGVDYGQVTVSTEANICLLIFYPRFKQDLLLRTQRDGAVDIDMVPGDWTLGLGGAVVDIHDFIGFRCRSLRTGSIEAESEHRARWTHVYKGVRGNHQPGSRA